MSSQDLVHKILINSFWFCVDSTALVRLVLVYASGMLILNQLIMSVWSSQLVKTWTIQTPITNCSIINIISASVLQYSLPVPILTRDNRLFKELSKQRHQLRYGERGLKPSFQDCNNNCNLAMNILLAPSTPTDGSKLQSLSEVIKLNDKQANLLILKSAGVMSLLIIEQFRCNKTGTRTSPHSIVAKKT